jgi:hypothetical protein
MIKFISTWGGIFDALVVNHLDSGALMKSKERLATMSGIGSGYKSIEPWNL